MTDTLGYKTPAPYVSSKSKLCAKAPLSKAAYCGMKLLLLPYIVAIPNKLQFRVDMAVRKEVLDSDECAVEEAIPIWPRRSALSFAMC